MTTRIAILLLPIMLALPARGLAHKNTLMAGTGPVLLGKDPDRQPSGIVVEGLMDLAGLWEGEAHNWPMFCFGKGQFLTLGFVTAYLELNVACLFDARGVFEKAPGLTVRGQLTGGAGILRGKFGECEDFEPEQGCIGFNTGKTHDMACAIKIDSGPSVAGNLTEGAALTCGLDSPVPPEP